MLEVIRTALDKRLTRRYPTLRVQGQSDLDIQGVMHLRGNLL
jgi:hypothetical protein